MRDSSAFHERKSVCDSSSHFCVVLRFACGWRGSPRSATIVMSALASPRGNSIVPALLADESFDRRPRCGRASQSRSIRRMNELLGERFGDKGRQRVQPVCEQFQHACTAVPRGPQMYRWGCHALWEVVYLNELPPRATAQLAALEAEAVARDMAR
eukprot:1083226-Prymnesium_polylepis.1